MQTRARSEKMYVCAHQKRANPQGENARTRQTQNARKY